MTIYRAWIWDDRPCDPDGPHETEQRFSQREMALKWLADWVREAIEGNDDLERAVEQRLLSLHDGGRYEELVAEYPTHVQVSWAPSPLRMGVTEEEVA